MFCRRTIHRRSRLRQKCGKMRGDGGVAGIRQTELTQSGSTLAHRKIAWRGDRQEALGKNLYDFVARQVNA